MYRTEGEKWTEVDDDEEEEVEWPRALNVTKIGMIYLMCVLFFLLAKYTISAHFSVVLLLLLGKLLLLSLVIISTTTGVIQFRRVARRPFAEDWMGACHRK